MKISAELSLYPLSDTHKPIIKDYIDVLRSHEQLDVRTHALSTEIFGEYDAVMSAINAATKTVFERDQGIVLIAKYLNKDRGDC